MSNLNNRKERQLHLYQDILARMTVCSEWCSYTEICYEIGWEWRLSLLPASADFFFAYSSTLPVNYTELQPSLYFLLLVGMDDESGRAVVGVRLHSYEVVNKVSN
jgi:hypothetical protein